jgi:hypothetical protein
MNLEQPPIPNRRPNVARNALKIIIFTGFVVGTLDMLGAIVVYQADPARMFRFIASGAFGAGTAFSGGAIMVVWGIVFHYAIAFAWTIVFFFVYPWLPILGKNKYITGALYGVFIWLIMNKVVIPLSAIASGPFDLKSATIGASILIVAVGVPISLLTHRYYTRKGILRGNS